MPQRPSLDYDAQLPHPAVVSDLARLQREGRVPPAELLREVARPVLRELLEQVQKPVRLPQPPKPPR